MVKHLFFNPNNFQELILSGVLIQMFKSDIQVHSQESCQALKFVQGHNIIEHSIEAILRFSSDYCKNNTFGRNTLQQAVINMISGVCKDIQKKLKTQTTMTDEFIRKVSDLNNFWNKTQNSWIKSKFYFCHMQILTLSFQIQEKYPRILPKYGVFMELRRLFIQKLMQREALQAMFANPKNKYQQFQLFPDNESFIQKAGECIEQIFQKKAVQAQRQITVEIVNMPQKEEYIQKSEEIQEKIQQAIKAQPLQNMASEENYLAQTPSNQKQAQVLRFQQSTAIKEVISDEKRVQQLLVQQIQQTIIQREFINQPYNQQPAPNLQNSQHSMKKSIKQSFSKQLIQPLEYSTRSLADEASEKILKQASENQNKKFQEQIDNKSKQNNQQKHNTANQEHKSSNQKSQFIKLEQQAVFDEVESQKYVSQQQFQEPKQQIKQVQKEQNKISQVKEQELKSSAASKNKEQKHKSSQKAPQSQTSNGPQSNIGKQKIKPKQQAVRDEKQSCKCQIY